MIEIDPELPEDERREIQHQIRLAFSDVSEDSELDYAVASLDLMSYDIDQGTFDNLALLILFATLVVIALLFVAFRNIKGVLFRHQSKCGLDLHLWFAQPSWHSIHGA